MRLSKRSLKKINVEETRKTEKTRFFCILDSSLFSLISAITEGRMQFSALQLFKVSYIPMLIGFFTLLFLHMVPFSGASSILKSSDDELTQYNFLYPRQQTKENVNSLTVDIQSRFDFMAKDITWLKTENKNHKEEIYLLKKQSENQKQEIYQLNNRIVKHEKEILQMKSSIENLQDHQYENQSTNHAMSNVSFGISNKRSVRAVTSKPAVKQTISATTKPTAKPQTKSFPTDTSSTSWAKREISDRVIGRMGYNSYTVKIYDHESNKDVNMKNELKKYYFEPIGQLNHLSAESSFNNISKKYEMTFDVNMWDDTVWDAVHRFISDGLNLSPVNKNLVSVLPLDNVVLYNAIGRSPHFEIEQDWIDYKSDKHLTFKFVCDRKKPCNDLALQMKSNPKQFRLKMRFSVSSQNSQTKETKISIESIMHGDMMNKLDQKYKGKEVVLLTADAKKELMKESSENVIIQTIDDTHVPSQSSKDEIYNRLEKMLEFSRTTIEKGDTKAWENVFWNEDNYRPDQSAKTVSDLHKKLDKENQKKLVSVFQNTNKVETELGAGGWGVSVNAKLAADFSRAGTDSKENLEKLLDEAKDRVEWDGVKFVPKQMELYSMNMARLRDKKKFTDTNIRVSYKTSMLSIDVRYDTLLNPRTPSEKLVLRDLMLEHFIELEQIKRKHISSGSKPSSCEDMSSLGHYLSGIYLVTNEVTKKVQAVYCKFKSSGAILWNAHAKCLSSAADGSQNGNVLNQWDCDRPQNGQLWSWNEFVWGSTDRHLCNGHRKCVAAPKNINDNIDLVQWEHLEENGQRFTLFNLDTNGFFMIKNGHGKCLGIESDSKNNAARAWALNCNPSENGQRWKWQQHTSVSQQLIGNLDVQTKIIHFYVQRNYPFSSKSVIPFHLALLNEGNAFNLPYGIFTAPVNGIYRFQFSAVKDKLAPALLIHLQVNGSNVGDAYSSKVYHRPLPTGYTDTVSLSSSLRLVKGDRVNLFNYEGELYDDEDVHNTHFSGWLVQEDLM